MTDVQTLPEPTDAASSEPAPDMTALRAEYTATDVKMQLAQHALEQLGRFLYPDDKAGAAILRRLKKELADVDAAVTVLNDDLRAVVRLVNSRSAPAKSQGWPG